MRRGSRGRRERPLHNAAGCHAGVLGAASSGDRESAPPRDLCRLPRHRVSSIPSPRLLPSSGTGTSPRQPVLAQQSHRLYRRLSLSLSRSSIVCRGWSRVVSSRLRPVSRPVRPLACRRCSGPCYTEFRQHWPILQRARRSRRRLVSIPASWHPRMSS